MSARPSRETSAAIIRSLHEMLPPGIGQPERVEVINGNDVLTRIAAAATQTAKVVGLVHNPDPASKGLLDLAQSLAAYASDHSPHSPGAEAPRDGVILRQLREIVLGGIGPPGRTSKQVT